jgi:hypothetical protein
MRFHHGQPVVATMLLCGGGIVGACTSVEKQRAVAPRDQELIAMGVMNGICPLTGWDVEADAPTRQYKGHTIGFCCGACPGKWDRWSEAQKDAFVAKYQK